MVMVPMTILRAALERLEDGVPLKRIVRDSISLRRIFATRLEPVWEIRGERFCAGDFRP